MKLTKYLAVAGSAALLLSACEKNLLQDNRQYSLFPENGTAMLKVMHAYASKQPSLTTSGPNVFVYLDHNKLNGNALTYAISQGTWPAPSTSSTNQRTLYAGVQPGNMTMLGIMARATPVAGDTVFNSAVNIAAGKYYTAVLSDTLPNASVTLLEDDFLPIPDGTFKVRLANFAAWPNDVYDLYSLREGKIIASGVGYKKASAFVSLPVPQLSDTLSIIKRSGNSPLSDTVGKVSFSGQSTRAYTILSRGKTTATSSAFQNFSISFITQW